MEEQSNLPSTIFHLADTLDLSDEKVKNNLTLLTDTSYDILRIAKRCSKYLENEGTFGAKKSELSLKVSINGRRVIFTFPI